MSAVRDRRRIVRRSGGLSIALVAALLAGAGCSDTTIPTSRAR